MPHSLQALHSSAPIIPLHSAQSAYPLDKLRIKESTLVHFIDYSEILYCEADSNYTIIHTIQNTKIVASQSLCKVTDSLPDQYFTRIHSKYIINILHLTAVKTSIPKVVILRGGVQLTVARRRFYTLKSILNL